MPKMVLDDVNHSGGGGFLPAVPTKKTGKKTDPIAGAVAQAAAKVGQTAAKAVKNTVSAVPAVKLPAGGKETAVTYVDTAGERRRGTAEDPYWAAMRDYYQQTWQQETDANNAAARAAGEDAAREAEAQSIALKAQTQGVNRQLYRDYMERRRLLPQQLAAQGYTGGMSESARVRLENSYGEALSDNERSRLAKEADIRAEANRQTARARAAADQANAQALRTRYDNLAKLRGEERQDTREQLRDRAERMAAAGDFSGYLALGYTPKETGYLAEIWRGQNPKLAELQRNLYTDVDAPAASDSAALAVARYIQQTRGTEDAIDYVAEALAKGKLFSDEAETIRRLLREGKGS